MLLINSLKENRDNGAYPFHMPGHKRNLAGDDLLRQIYGIDITETEGFDDLHNAHGIIEEAESRAAELFGSDETHFLVNGSTCGILAAITGSVTSGDSLIIASNCHRSVYNALMISGAKPYVIKPGSESYFEISGGVSVASVEKALDAADGKRIAVVITSPTYEGITSDITAIADSCHKKGAVLIVDAAHGAHFGLSGDFPMNAVSSGADVVISSVHKTLPAMTQTALIHISKDCPSKQRIRKMLPVFMTSSPSYVLMASVDSMTDLLKQQGTELFKRYVERLDDFYDKAKDFKCLSVLNKDKLTAEGSVDHDRSKIVISDMTSTYYGKELSDILREQYGICSEMAAETYVLLMTSIADTDEAFACLVKALSDIDEKLCDRQVLPKARGFVKRIFDSVVGSRIAKYLQTVPVDEVETDKDPGVRTFDNRITETVFADNVEFVPVELSEGRTAADFVSVFPPGIPVTVPGDVISGEAADKLLRALENGLEVTGLKDKEIAVLWERSSTL
ncbi:MAG: aminotransferase class I/II-fold pyridoxal phosphate-dependent enzyme [Lachnospiraceae bacterium]|nr:aminotransferase class I/II-fold pyridoxal phosphate-dependent enzyme [Lachnospiraceae bacterium]